MLQSKIYEETPNDDFIAVGMRRGKNYKGNVRNESQTMHFHSYYAFSVL